MDNEDENNNGNKVFKETNPPIVSATINADNIKFHYKKNAILLRKKSVARVCNENDSSVINVTTE